MQDLGAGGSELEHLLVGHYLKLTRLGHDTRVGAEDPSTVGVDLAHVRAQRGGKGHGRRVGSASAQGGDVLGVLRHTLEAGHDGDGTGLEGLLDATRGDVDDAGGPVSGVSDESRLGTV